MSSPISQTRRVLDSESRPVAFCLRRLAIFSPTTSLGRTVRAWQEGRENAENTGYAVARCVAACFSLWQHLPDRIRGVFTAAALGEHGDRSPSGVRSVYTDASVGCTERGYPLRATERSLVASRLERVARRRRSSNRATRCRRRDRRDDDSIGQGQGRSPGDGAEQRCRRRDDRWRSRAPGDRAAKRRRRQRSATQEANRARPQESAGSKGTFLHRSGSRKRIRSPTDPSSEEISSRATFGIGSSSPRSRTREAGRTSNST